MIIPNLMVENVSRAAAFYVDCIGLKPVFSVNGEKNTAFGEIADDAVFAILETDGAQLMLQAKESLVAEFPSAGFETAQAPSSAVYFRDMDPDAVLEKTPADSVLKGPEMAWYGMYEVHVRDPDGHVVSVGIAKGDPPA